MKIKEIYEETVFGVLTPAYVQDYNTCYVGKSEDYLNWYNKASRKNAARKYRNIKDLLDQDAVIIKNTRSKIPTYHIETKRSINGAFGRKLEAYEEIIIK